MAVKIYNVEFQRMALEPSLRNDSNFISFENASLIDSINSKNSLR